MIDIIYSSINRSYAIALKLNKSAFLAIALLAVTAIAIIWYADQSAAGDAYHNLQDSGALFHPDFGVATDASFETVLTKQQAVDIAVENFMSGFDIPHDRGIEAKIDTRAVTATFSGSSDGSSREWDVIDRNVWVVSLLDLPISLPCGGAGGGDGCPESVNPPHRTVAVDATTGEVVGTEMAGGGGISSTWDNVDLTREYDTPLANSTQIPTDD